VKRPGLDTLTIPIMTDTLINAGSGNILVAVQTGQFVATAVTPEPSVDIRNDRLRYGRLWPVRPTTIATQARLEEGEPSSF
jgi:hypothetical protein